MGLPSEEFKNLGSEKCNSRYKVDWVGPTAKQEYASGPNRCPFFPSYGCAATFVAYLQQVRSLMDVSVLS